MESHTLGRPCPKALGRLRRPATEEKETEMSYDAKCETLAEEFLSDFQIERQAVYRSLARQLAQRIQDIIEDFIEEKELKERL